MQNMFFSISSNESWKLTNKVGRWKLEWERFQFSDKKGDKIVDFILKLRFEDTCKKFFS